jgi:hypothetical protein
VSTSSTKQTAPSFGSVLRLIGLGFRAEDERLFDYAVCFFDGENWRTFRFSVDDCTAQDHPIVVAVSHRLGRIRVRF